MTAEEGRAILAIHLAKFRSCTYAELADRARRREAFPDIVDGVAADGTPYGIEVNVFWEDRRKGNIRVVADISTGRLLLDFLPICFSEAADSFIMTPEGTFLGEHESTSAEQSGHAAE